jgi:hypothetical protein
LSGLNVTSSAVRFNSAGNGGGIAIDAIDGDVPASIRRSVITANTAGGAEQDGGGIINSADTGHEARTDITDSLVTSSIAPDALGGGLFNISRGSEAHVKMTRVAFAGNSAACGGAVAQQGTLTNALSLSLTGGIVTRNTATSAGGAGGLQIVSGIYGLTDSPVLGNTAPDIALGACAVSG